MQKLPNFDFSAVKTISGMLTSLEEQVRLLATYVDDCDPLDDDDRDELLENMEGNMPAQSLARLARMHGKRKPLSMVALHEDAAFVQAVHNVGNVGKADGDLPFIA